jgi:hypothetical protein
MHLKGPMVRWLQPVERRLKHASWQELCSLIHDRFSRDQHEALICQLFHIRQEGTITKYVDQFSALIDQLSAYESEANLLYYAMRFVDGLREEIKSMAMIQLLATLDAACALALVQGEATDSVKKKDHMHGESGISRSFSRFVVSGHAFAKFDKPTRLSLPDDKHATEATHAVVQLKTR